MPLEITVEFKGLADIDAAFRELPIALERAALRDGLRAGAEVYRDGMSKRAPEQTGALKSSITYQVVVKPGTGEAVARIGPERDAFYGSFVELGTRFMPPRPFMRPTLVEDGQVAISAFVHAIRRNFDRLLSRIRRRA